MKNYKYIFFALILCFSLHTYAQWNKLPKQVLTTYPQTNTGGSMNSVVIFPKLLRPISDGHILISSYYYNGSLSSYGIQNVIYETKNDFSSHNAIYQTTEAVECFFARDDSSYSWIAKNVGPYYSASYNKVTLNGFATLDTSYLCTAALPNRGFATCLTNNYIYSVERGEIGNQIDTMRIGSSLLNNPANTSCTKLPNYNTPVGAMNFLNDSTLFFDCCSKANSLKKVILKSIDFGKSWDELYVDSVNSILSYDFTSASIGYILLSNNTLMKTINGGVNWTSQTFPSSTLTCFAFSNDSLGYIGGNNGFLSKTIDGGQTWINEISGTNHQLKEIFTINVNVAYFKDSLSDLYKNTPLLVSVKEYEKNKEIKIFPNPCNSIINIQSKHDLDLIIIFNVLGEIVFQVNIKETNLQIDISDFSSGIYTIKLREGYSRLIKE